MKKNIIPVVLIIIFILLGIIFLIFKNYNKEISNNTEILNNDKTQYNEISNNIINGKNKADEIMNTVYIKINNRVLNIELEDNSATIELKERLKNGDITVNAHEYGGFEKVGELGFSLPREDLNITTSSGDIVLYQGNKISLFYNSNSWSYTKLGRLQNVSTDELKDILGNGDVAITFTLSR